MVVIAMALYRASLSFVIVVSCWSSGSRMICGRGVGAGGVWGFVGLVWSDRELCRSVVEEYLLKVDFQLGRKLSWVKSEG